MSKYSKEDGLKSLDRVKLLMSYKNTMTLTENLEVISEQILQGVFPSGKALSDNVKSILNACTSDAKIPSRTFSDEKIDEIAKLFFDAFEGFVTGTDLTKMREALNKLKEGGLGDLCAVN